MFASIMRMINYDFSQPKGEHSEGSVGEKSSLETGVSEKYVEKFYCFK